MDAAEHDFYSARAVGRRDVVAPVRGLAVDADADQVDVLQVALDVERLHEVVGVDDLVLGRRERGEDAEAETREERGVFAGRGDELDLHEGPGELSV